MGWGRVGVGSAERVGTQRDGRARSLRCFVLCSSNELQGSRVSNAQDVVAITIELMLGYEGLLVQKSCVVLLVNNNERVCGLQQVDGFCNGAGSKERK